MTIKGRLKNVTNAEMLDLFMYLQVHESDIASKVNDFGDLERLFVAIFERVPRAKWGKK